MQKIKMLLAATLFAAPAMADEGMWTLFNLPQAVYNTMQQEGFSLPYADLYQSSDAISRAVVNFSGYCSGVVVSPDGLVFTNHHCGFEAIRSHSTVDHDYMLNGFYAKSYEEELPNENMFVSFMISHSTYHVEVQPFYESNSFYATTYQDFTDLRLVFTVPKSMGKFGGETDNWMWPRQTCDFSVFRIYANPKTNGPAAYSKDNVPYHPKHWAQVSLQGYKQGDFAMTMGYPGSTNRYLSSYGIKEMRDAENAVRAQARGVRQEVHMDASEAVRIKYDSKYAQSANYWKNSIGMNKCIDSIGIIQNKAAYEQKIASYVDSTGFLKGRLSFPLLQKAYNNRYQYVHDYMEYRENLRQCLPIQRALKALSMVSDELKDGNEKSVTISLPVDTAEWDLATEKEIMVAMLRNYREKILDHDLLPDLYQTIDGDFKGDYTAYVNQLFDKSALMKEGQSIVINKKTLQKDAPKLRTGGRIHARRKAFRILHHGRKHHRQDGPLGPTTRLEGRAHHAPTSELRRLRPLPRQADGKDAALLPHQQRHHGRQQRFTDVQRKR